MDGGTRWGRRPAPAAQVCSGHRRGGHVGELPDPPDDEVLEDGEGEEVPDELEDAPESLPAGDEFDSLPAELLDAASLAEPSFDADAEVDAFASRLSVR